MELFLSLYLQPIFCKLDFNDDFFDNSKFSFPNIFQTLWCHLGDLCLCKKVCLVNVRILGSISVLIQPVCDYNYLDVFHQELVNEFGERDSRTSILIQAVEIAADIAMTEYVQGMMVMDIPPGIEYTQVRIIEMQHDISKQHC